MMKYLLILITIFTGPSYGQELTNVDRQLLLEKLKAIQESADTAARGRFGTAVAAFRAASGSDVAAYELWLKCVEKVNFKDEARKGKDFREWKKRNKEAHSRLGFRRALRYQLGWLLKTIEVSQNPDSRAEMSDASIAMIEAILRDAKLLSRSQQTLQGSVLGSYFAKAYDIDGLKVDNWVLTPLNIAGMYEQIILPPWRESKNLTLLRKGWLKRIEHQGKLVEHWSREGQNDRRPAFEKWLNNERLDLKWSMEKDLYAHGEQRDAALRMLDHVKKHLSHEKAPLWIREFTELIDGQESEDPAEEKEPGDS